MPQPVSLLTFDDYIAHWGQHQPAALALTDGDRQISFSALDRLTRQAIGMFASLGVKPGDRIGWLGKNSLVYYLLFYAAARTGIVMVPVGWRLAAPEIRFIVDDVEPAVLFHGAGFGDSARLAAIHCRSSVQIVSEQDAWQLLDVAQAGTYTAAGPDDAVLQLYTSGTTGNPKGAVLSNRNLFGLRLPSIDANLPWTRWNDDELVLVCMPCAHIGGTGVGVMAMAAGVGALIHSEFNPDWVLDAVEAGVTRFFMVPAALQMVVQHPRALTSDFSRLRYVMYGAAPIPLELLRECMQVMDKAGFMQVYGMTETTGTVVYLPAEDHDPVGNRRMRAAGKPLPGVEIKIVDEAGRSLPAETIGEVMIRSSGNMLHYWKLPDATAATLDADGWVRTGDAGILDADGYLYIQDRVKDMIISGGENVYPAEVESAIYGHPDVAEVAVIGVPDDQWGEAVKACIVAKPGCQPQEASIIAWARERIAPFKAPKSIDILKALPRNATGKILRRALREPYWKGRERQVN